LLGITPICLVNDLSRKLALFAAALLLFAPEKGASQQETPVAYGITTVAGSSCVGDGGPALSAVLVQPEGIAVDSRGNIYVSDAADHRVRRIGPDGIIKTVAGNGIAGFSGDGGAAELAQLNSPYGICLDRSGNLYIADLNNARVRKISFDGKISTVAGGGRIAPGEDGDGGLARDAKLGSPRNVAVDSEGAVYISDFSGHRVYKVAVTGNLTTVAGSGAAGMTGDNAAATRARLSFPAGLAVDRFGILYIADSGNKRVRRVYQGVIGTVGDTGKPGQNALLLASPTGLAVDSTGNLYVADGRATTLRLSPAGAVSTLPIGGGDLALDAADQLYVTVARSVRRMQNGSAVTVAGTGFALSLGDGGAAAASRLNTPLGIARDAAGILYIADSKNQRVRMVNGQGTITTFAGTPPSSLQSGSQATAVSLNLPGYVAVDSRGTVYIADTGSHQIRAVGRDGRLTTIAGSEAGFGGDNGPASLALLNAPVALAVARDDSLYVADSGNHRVRRITPDGYIATVAGGAGGDVVGDDDLAVLAKLVQPGGVAFDGVGNLYISEAGGNRIRKVSRTGLISTIADARSANLRQPLGLKVNAAGDVFIADSGNHRIRRISAAGQLSTIAGSGIAGFSGDAGPAVSGMLNTPTDVFLEPDGSLLIADSGNHRIRRLTPGAQEGLIAEQQLSAITVLHGATLKQQAVAPGQIVSLFGAGLGPLVGVIGKLTDGGILEVEVAGTRVSFDGKPAPLFYVQDGQVNAQVPYGVAGKSDVEVVVTVNGSVRAKNAVRIAAAAPGLLTANGGSGQALAVNQDGTVNSPESPAPRGSVVTLYVTGDGQSGAVDGRPATAAEPSAANVVMEIGGFRAEVLYAGRAPGLVGLMQINARVAGGFAPSGILPVVLKINGESAQNGVTVAIR